MGNQPPLPNQVQFETIYSHFTMTVLSQGNEAPVDYEYDFDDFDVEAAGVDFDEANEAPKRNKGGFGQHPEGQHPEDEDNGNSGEPAYMFFDFRRGTDR